MWYYLLRGYIKDEKHFLKNERRVHHGGNIAFPDDNRRGGGDNASVTHGKH